MRDSTDPATLVRMRNAARPAGAGSPGRPYRPINRYIQSTSHDSCERQPLLKTEIGPIRLERPTMLASGILGISMDVFESLYDAGAGAVVTKSLSREPWEGYPNPTVVGLGGGGWINAVGSQTRGRATLRP